MLTAVAYSGLYIAWNDATGFSRNQPGNPPWVPNGQTGLVMLIFTPTTNYTSVAEAGFGITTGEIILDYQYVDNSIGNDYGAGFSYIYGNADGSTPFMAGYVFIRVFDQGTVYGSISAGTWYYQGPYFQTVDNPGVPVLPDQVDTGTPAGGPGPFGTFIFNQQVVPEPALLSMFALGGACLLFRRKIKS